MFLSLYVFADQNRALFQHHNKEGTNRKRSKEFIRRLSVLNHVAFVAIA